MGRAYAEFQDVKGQVCRIGTIDADNLGAIKTYANVVKGYSDAGLKAVGYTATEITKPTPGATSNVDKKGIVIVQDTKRGATHMLTIPGLKSGQTETTLNGERLKSDVVDKIASAYGTLIGTTCVGLYGYPTQSK